MKTTKDTLHRIDQIRSRLKLASAGPWVAVLEGRDQSSGSSFIRTFDGNEITFYPDEKNLDDIDFIAFAREDVEFLLNLVDEQLVK